MFQVVEVLQLSAVLNKAMRAKKALLEEYRQNILRLWQGLDRCPGATAVLGCAVLCCAVLCCAVLCVPPQIRTESCRAADLP